MVHMEAVSVGDFLVLLVRDQPAHVPYLMHLLKRRTCAAMRVLHRHEDEQQSVVVLLDELIEELARLLDIGVKLQASHMLLPLAELVLDP